MPRRKRVIKIGLCPWFGLRPKGEAHFFWFILRRGIAPPHIRRRSRCEPVKEPARISEAPDANRCKPVEGHWESVEESV